MSDIVERAREHYNPSAFPIIDGLIAEIKRLRADNERLRAALKDMIEISRRNGEATQLLWAIGRCAEHALRGEE